MSGLHDYDPALAEAAEQGHHDDELAVIVRLPGDGVLPDGVRVISSFADLKTVRVRRGRLADLAACESVVALEASRPMRLTDDGPPEPAGPTGTPAPYTRRPPGLRGTGRDVVVAVLDWGIDLGHRAFRRDDGSTRFLAFWNQHGDASEGTGNRWGYGRVFRADDIDRALREPDPYRALGYHPADADERDPDTGQWKGAHGTHVLDIAAGSRREGALSGVAPDAHLVGVHLARTARVLGRGNLGDSVTVLEALDFAFDVAGDLPCVVNMSIGAHGGPHDGTTLVEQGIDRALSLRAGRAAVLSAGNYFPARAHARGRVRPGQDAVLRFTVAAGDPTDSELEIYYESADRLTVLVVAPSLDVAARVAPGQEAPIVVGGAIVGRVYHIQRDPSGDRHVDLFLRPHAPAGVWEVRLTGEDNGSTTGTLCNGRLTIAVGAYDPHRPRRPIASFSSAGPTRDGRVKPEIVAPGVGIVAARSTPRSHAPASGSGYTTKAGTSMAAPHVTGTVALMLQAAPVPLEIEDTRALLFGSADCAGLGDRTPVSELHRLGYGYLDTAAAEEAAAMWGRAVAPDERDVVDQPPIEESPGSVPATNVACGGTMCIDGAENAHPTTLAEPRSTRQEEAITVDDVASDMDGLRCGFLMAYTASRADGARRMFSEDSLHPLESWNGTADEAVVGGFPVPKVVLAPRPDEVAGPRRYDVPLDAQRAAVFKSLRAVSDWAAKESSYLANRALWEREKKRLDDLLARRRLVYSRLWVRQMMYNRFDVAIATWTQHYNGELKPRPDLDPNVVKSMFYQESRMGTSGRHLMPPPYDWSSSDHHPIRSRFNLGQTIDSWGPQQWLMMKEMAPEIYRRHGLDALESGRRWFGMSNSDYAAHPTFMAALREFFEHRDGDRNLMGTPGRNLHEDYGFWIRTAIRWLFVKFSALKTPTWSEAVRAYNGSGPRARRYRDEVMARVGSTAPFTEDLQQPESRPEELIRPAPEAAPGRAGPAPGRVDTDAASVVADEPEEPDAGGAPAAPVGLEAEGADVLEPFREAMSAGRWDAALEIAIGKGERDENKLTNMVFFARHPELGGRPIQPGERALVAEWLQLRDTLVRPALRARRSAPSGAAEARQPRSTEALRRAWHRYRCAEDSMVMLRVLSHRTPVNRLAVAAFTALDEALRATGYEATKTWAYVCRSIAGSTNYSLHAYGIAADIDASCNPHRKNTTGPVRFSDKPTQQERCADVHAGRAETSFTPSQIEAVEGIRTVDGLRVFAWGGRWRTSHDTMHFQVDVTPEELERGIAPQRRPAETMPEVEEEEAGLYFDSELDHDSNQAPEPVLRA